MDRYHRVIGIDLGTTFSVVAVYQNEKADVVVVPNRQGERTTPSVVYVSGAGTVTVGRDARRKLETDPSGVVIEAKRLMGHADAGGQKHMVKAGKREFDPELISAYVLKELKACAEKFVGAEIHDAVITVPAYFKEPQKKATEEAARIARLNPRALINEPTAAAIAYGLESGERQTFAVYDFGGGTFDVSIVRVEDATSVTVLGTGGDAHLGGGDIDQRIVDWALRRIREEHGVDFSGDAKVVGRCRLEAERVKVTLCNSGGPEEFSLANLPRDIDEVRYVLTPADFEAMVQPILARTLDEVDVALRSAAKNHDLTLDDLDAFILVGGSSKIPAVGRALRERFRKPIKADLNPDEIVAMGAARAATNYQPSTGVDIRDNAEVKIDRSAELPNADSTNWKDVVSHTLGVGLKDDLYDALIAKDHPIPHKVVRGGYTTAHDNQTNIYVPVYQGDQAKASANHQIGKVVIADLAPQPKGFHQFEITFALDASGIFEGEIKHLQTGKVEKITLDRGHGQIVEKKRMELAAMVASGAVGSLPPTNPVDALIAKVTEALGTMPPAKQREATDLLVKLTTARASGDSAAMGAAVSALTLLVTRHSN